MDLDFARPAAARVASAIEGRCGIEAPCVGVDMSKPPSRVDLRTFSEPSEIGVEFAFGQDGELKIRSCIGVDGTKRPSPADLEAGFAFWLDGDLNIRSCTSCDEAP